MFKNFYALILTIVGIIGSLFFAFLQGKKSKENEENKKIVENVQKINKKKFEVSKLSDDELDKRLSKFKRPNN